MLLVMFRRGKHLEMSLFFYVYCIGFFFKAHLSPLPKAILKNDFKQEGKKEDWLIKKPAFKALPCPASFVLRTRVARLFNTLRERERFID